MQRTHSATLLLFVWCTHRISGQLSDCLLEDVELEFDANSELNTNSAPGFLTCTPEQGLAQEGQVITIIVTSQDPDGILQDEDFSLVTAYDDSCNSSVAFEEFRNAQPTSNLTFNRNAACFDIEGTNCDISKVPLSLPTPNSTLCVRVYCDNNIADCDLLASVAIEEDVNSGNDTEVALCSVNRHDDINTLLGFRNYRSYSCGGTTFGFGDDELENGATLSYNIRVTDPDDRIRVYHANGDSCDEAPDADNFEPIDESSCRTAMESCEAEGVEVPAGGPDCVIVECANGDTAITNTECNVQVDITWSGQSGADGAGRPAIPALFVGLLTIIFTLWS